MRVISSFRSVQLVGSSQCRVLCVLDHFGAGGAQRQMVNLAGGLARKGYRVGVWHYFPEHNFFRHVLDGAGVMVEGIDKKKWTSLERVKALRRLFRSGNWDIVISFLDTPNICCELACLSGGRIPLIVSERSSRHHDRSRLWGVLKRVLHAGADRIVANSHSHADWLRKFPWCRRKVHVVYNGVELPSWSQLDPPRHMDQLRLVSVGRIGPEKNPLQLLKALKLLLDRCGALPELVWVGGPDASRRGVEYRSSLDEWMGQHPEIAKHWKWAGLCPDVHGLLSSSHSLVLASRYEGLPNVICESFAAGRPVIASCVCDHPLLVGRVGERGFLFDSEDPGSVADAIQKLIRCDVSSWRQLSVNARRYAEEELSIQRMVAGFEALIERCVRGGK